MKKYCKKKYKKYYKQLKVYKKLKYLIKIMILVVYNIFYKTSGANETILVKLYSRNSRATGPNTRVPLGFPS